MAYFRCSGGNSSGEGIFPPQGKMYTNGTVPNFAASASLTTWGGTLIFNGKDLEGKRIKVNNNNSRDLTFTARYIKDNAQKSYDSSNVPASDSRVYSFINDVDLAICTCFCRVNTTSQMSLSVQIVDN